VGHEIDFTIADFAADRRAPTPSAAAELAVPDREELGDRLEILLHRLQNRTVQQQRLRSSSLQTLQQRHGRLHPGLQLEQRQQRLDELAQRLVRGPENRLQQWSLRLQHLQSRLEAHAPVQRLRQMEQRTEELHRRLLQSCSHRLQRQQHRMTAAVRTLQALSPLATLDRGYSITQKLPEGEVLHDSRKLRQGDLLETRLGSGRIISRVESTKE
jgi:exodeoxyribonuclease VII large subunit